MCIEPPLLILEMHVYIESLPVGNTENIDVTFRTRQRKQTGVRQNNTAISFQGISKMYNRQNPWLDSNSGCV